MARQGLVICDYQRAVLAAVVGGGRRLDSDVDRRPGEAGVRAGIFLAIRALSVFPALGVSTGASCEVSAVSRAAFASKELPDAQGRAEDPGFQLPDFDGSRYSR